MYFTQDYKELLEIFNEHEVKYLVAGAFAMSKLGYLEQLKELAKI